MIQHMFQLLPVFLALIAAVVCSRHFATHRRRRDRTAMALAVSASVLLVVAQTSWWTTYLIQGDLLGTWFANMIWTIFNTVVMVVFILIALPRKGQ